MPRIALFVLLLSIVPVSCMAPGVSSFDSLDAPPLIRVKKSVEGRPVDYRVYGEGDETVLFLATIHGDEAAGTPLLETLGTMIESDPALIAEKRVVIVPVVNPDGLANGTRRNANGVDLNRNFPAVNYLQTTTHGPGSLSEPESRFIHHLVQVVNPALIVSFHQPADRIDYDGPAASIAYRIAAASPMEVRRMGARHGSLGSWAGHDVGIPVVTVELPRSADELSPEEAWETYGPLVLEALK